MIKSLIRKGVERRLPRGYDVDTHFKPRYDPWDQRVCLVPDGDLFQAIHKGQASVVTDRVETFTEKGLKLASGAELEADVIVTATGLNVLMLGGMTIGVDGRELDLPEAVSYKGMMFGGVPNLAYALGYTNASWTLKCDLVAEHVCRLLGHMDEHGHAQCMPSEHDPALETQPLIDLTSGYVLRSIDAMPRQGMRAPWRLHQNYARDIRMLRHGALEDGAMEFSTPARAPMPSMASIP
jgi:cation diffusion facilitator CzcD-associated flavoprotein CzcO